MDVPLPIDVHQEMEKLSDYIANGLMGADGPERDHVIHDTAQLVGMACGEGPRLGPPNLNSILAFISAAHGMHEAGQRSMQTGDAGNAEHYHGMGQLFLTYAAGEIEKMAMVGAVMEQSAPGKTLARMFAEASASLHGESAPEALN